MSALFCEMRPEDLAARLWSGVEAQALTVAALVQAGAAVLALVAALVLARRIAPGLAQRLAGMGGAERFPRLAAVLPRLAAPLLAAVLLGVCAAIAGELGSGNRLLEGAAALCLAWAAARAGGALIQSRFWARTLAGLALALAFLHVFGLLAALVRLLHGLGLFFGGTYISVLSLAKGLALGIVLVQAAKGVSRFLELRVAELPQVSPSLQVLFAKGFKFVLITLAVLIAVGAMGVDLTGLAVFSGAVGVAVGFGLQKIFSNLVAGVILLLDRSIKPGDMLEVGGTVGVLNTLNARFVSILTPDGKELLVPNEDLVTSRVVNWSYSSRVVQVSAKVGVAYDTDVRKALALLERAAAGVGRVLGQPPPKAQLAGFGDSSIDLELGFWINDPQNGVANVRGEVLLAIWDAFRESGVEIPFPQREVRVKGY